MLHSPPVGKSRLPVALLIMMCSAYDAAKRTADSLSASQGGGAPEGQGIGRSRGLRRWDRGEAVLPPPLALIYAAFAVFEYLALNGMPSVR